jgi:hypothetical protein
MTWLIGALSTLTMCLIVAFGASYAAVDRLLTKGRQLNVRMMQLVSALLAACATLLAYLLWFQPLRVHTSEGGMAAGLIAFAVTFALLLPFTGIFVAAALFGVRGSTASAAGSRFWCAWLSTSALCFVCGTVVYILL